MDRAVLSWNAVTPGNSAVELLLRAQIAPQRWSNWFRMGVWGSHIPSHSIKGQSNAFGAVDIDTLELKTAARDWQYKIILHDSDHHESPTINAIGLTVKNSPAMGWDCPGVGKSLTGACI